MFGVAEFSFRIPSASASGLEYKSTSPVGPSTLYPSPGAYFVILYPFIF